MKATYWIDRVKVEKKWESDYRVGKELGLSRNTIGNFRSGRSNTMDETTAIKVAEALGISPAGVVLDQIAERSKSELVRSTLSREAERLYIMLSKATIKRIAKGTKSTRDFAGNPFFFAH